MSSPAPIIEARSISKSYRLGSRAQADTLVGALRQSLTAPLRNLRELRSRRNAATSAGEGAVHHALRDVSFSVREGEVLGIIGRNGAGKSTLLKIMSRITEPSSGFASVRGRVSSLLEVGTGFHHELSGRDNVFMNGTILGMTQREVHRKFDEIVAFSGVEAFIDTPVKYYSSGMKVRLAFAVAAHLDPEVLIIDEVLAVGDLAFQEKCLQKMDSVSRSGRTILFVSHNMVAVEGLCTRCLLLEDGRATYNGTVAEAISRYRRGSIEQAEGGGLAERRDREGEGRVRFTGIRFNRGAEVFTGRPLHLEIDLWAEAAIDNLQIAIKFSRGYREVVTCLDNRMQGCALAVRPGANTVTVAVPRLDLIPSHYLVDLWAGSSTQVEDRIFNVARLHVAERDVYATGIIPKSNQHGFFIPPACAWTAEAGANTPASSPLT